MNDDDSERGERGVRRRDAAIDRAKRELIRLFEENPSRVFYRRQLTVALEDTFFHWITGKGLAELEKENAIASAALEVAVVNSGAGEARQPEHFYFSKKNRYWRREARAIRALIQRFSAPDFGRALGAQGELLVDAGFARLGFVRRGKNVREWKGRSWTLTGHNLDRVFERGGVDYGVEVKNTLDYIEMKEFETKLAMCVELRLVPIFVMRAAPKSYMHRIIESGGVGLLLKKQAYPFAQEVFAEEVRARLDLPTYVVGELDDGSLARLEKGLAYQSRRRGR